MLKQKMHVQMLQQKQMRLRAQQVQAEHQLKLQQAAEQSARHLAAGPGQGVHVSAMQPSQAPSQQRIVAFRSSQVGKYQVGMAFKNKGIIVEVLADAPGGFAPAGPGRILVRPPAPAPAPAPALPPAPAPTRKRAPAQKSVPRLAPAPASFSAPAPPLKPGEPQPLPPLVDAAPSL